MAVTYQRLFPATNQFEVRSGALNVNGQLKVFLDETDDLARCYDENGTILQQPIILDSLGRSRGLLVDDSKVYRLEVYDSDASLLYTVRHMSPGGGGTGSALGNRYSVTSSDGFVNVEEFDDGGVTTFDLTRGEDSTELLGWIRCDGGVAVPDTDTWRPTYTAGNLLVGDKGVVLTAGQYYHATARVRITKSGVAPTYDDMQLVFKTDDGTDTVQVARKGIVVDGSMGLYQDFEISADVLADADCELCLDVTGKELSVVGVQLLDMEVHRVYSGAPYIPGGVATKPWLEENYQEKLTAGTGITIGDDGVISVDESVINEIFPVTYNVTTFNEIRTALIDGKLPVLYKGDPEELAVRVQRIPIYELFDGGTYKYAQFWTPYVYSSPSAAYPPYANFEVFSASYDNGTGTTTWSTSHKYFAEQSDWAEADAKKLTFIKNKPDISVYVTNSALATTLADYVTDSELETILDGYVTAGDLQEAIADVRQVPASTAQDATKVLTVDSNGDPAWAPAQAPISAGDGISISNNVVSAKVDGTTITTNSSGELETVSVVPPMKELVAGNNITLTENANDVTVACSVTIGTVTV